jgi:hypothetical protein
VDAHGEAGTSGVVVLDRLLLVWLQRRDRTLREGEVSTGRTGSSYGHAEPYHASIADFKSLALTLAAIWQPFDKICADGAERSRTHTG